VKYRTRAEGDSQANGAAALAGRVAGDKADTLVCRPFLFRATTEHPRTS
jgi:hypothetical protein